ncbi:MAG: SPOR domain-containing protein [Patiriisocius sp.]
MQLSPYIKDLLYRYECVIIPGFGAFLANYTSASIHVDSSTFYPPGKTISFNRQLQTNDGLLANYVASVEGISYESALQKIRNYTGLLSLKLSKAEQVTLDTIGDFSLTPENKVQFVPCDTENFNITSFGLSSFVSSEISRDLQQKRLDAAQKTLAHGAPTRSVAPYIKYAAVGLIAMAVCGLTGLKIYEGTVQEHNFAQKQKANSKLEKQIQQATFSISSPLPTLEVPVVKQTGRYHVVAGAFRIKENAERKVAQLHKKGFAAVNLGTNKYGLHQVVYASYQNRLQALKNLRVIKASQNSDAWLLVK